MLHPTASAALKSGRGPAGGARRPDSIRGFLTSGGGLRNSQPWPSVSRPGNSSSRRERARQVPHPVLIRSLWNSRRWPCPAAPDTDRRPPAVPTGRPSPVGTAGWVVRLQLDRLGVIGHGLVPPYEAPKALGPHGPGICIIWSQFDHSGVVGDGVLVLLQKAEPYPAALLPSWRVVRNDLDALAIGLHRVFIALVGAKLPCQIAVFLGQRSFRLGGLLRMLLH